MKEWIRPQPEHGKLTPWMWMVLHPENLRLGQFTDIGAFTLIQAECGVWIGKNSQVGAHSVLYSVDSEGGESGEIHIGKHVRIGSHCSIMPNVTIGDFAVVGAHSFLISGTHIPAYALAYGVPCKVVKGGYGARNIEGEDDSSRRWTRVDRRSDCATAARVGGISGLRRFRT